MESKIEKLKEEIKKCEIVCANCHRRRTAIRGNFLKWTDSSFLVERLVEA